MHTGWSALEQPVFVDDETGRTSVPLSCTQGVSFPSMLGSDELDRQGLPCVVQRYWMHAPMISSRGPEVGVTCTDSMH